MRVKSKFNFLAIFLISFITVLPLPVFCLAAISPKAGMILPLVLLGFIVFFWLTILRTRGYKVEIDDNTVILKRYFGVGRSASYDFSTVDGFITLFESAKGSVYVSLFILKNGKRVGSISSFYHSNFDQLKSVLKDKLIDLGERESTFKNESYELFK